METPHKQPEPTITSPQNLTPNIVLPGIVPIFSSAIGLYKKRWLPLILASAVSTIATYLASLLLLGSVLVSFFYCQNPVIIFVTVAVISILISFIYAILTGISLRILTADHKESGLMLALKWAFKNSIQLWWLYIVLFLVIVGGFGLLIIPGILFCVWFIFALFVFATENIKGFDALFKSKAYVKGCFWQIAWRLVPPLILFFVVYILPINSFIKLVVFLILNPFLFAYVFQVYSSLKIARVYTVENPHESKIFYFILGIIGLLAPAIFLSLIEYESAKDEASYQQTTQSLTQFNTEIHNLANGTTTPAVVATTTPVSEWSTYTSNADSPIGYSLKYDPALGTPTVSVNPESDEELVFHPLSSEEYAALYKSGSQTYLAWLDITFNDVTYSTNYFGQTFTQFVDQSFHFSCSNSSGNDLFSAPHWFTVGGRKAVGVDSEDLGGETDYEIQLKNGRVLLITVTGSPAYMNDKDENGNSTRDKIIQSLQFTTPSY